MDAEEGAAPIFPSIGSSAFIPHMVYVGANCALVMEEGSKLSGLTARSDGIRYYPVYLYHNARFELNGGAMTRFSGLSALIGLEHSSSRFVYRGGTVTESSSTKVRGSESVSVDYTDLRFREE